MQGYRPHHPQPIGHIMQTRIFHDASQVGRFRKGHGRLRKVTVRFALPAKQAAYHRHGAKEVQVEEAGEKAGPKGA